MSNVISFPYKIRNGSTSETLTEASTSSDGQLLVNVGGNLSFSNTMPANINKGSGSAILTQIYVDSATLTANTTTTVSALTYVAANFVGCKIDYVMIQATSGDVETGSLYISNNGTSTVSCSQSGGNTADVQVTASAVINGSNIEVRFTNAHATNDCTLRADVKQFRA